MLMLILGDCGMSDVRSMVAIEDYRLIEHTHKMSRYICMNNTDENRHRALEEYGIDKAGYKPQATYEKGLISLGRFTIKASSVRARILDIVDIEKHTSSRQVLEFDLNEYEFAKGTTFTATISN